MAYLALYRKYRPTTFENLVGQEHIVKTLTNQITSDKLGHAYLFTGTRGTGKTSAAKIFAKAINCQTPINGSPCGACASCKALSDPSNIDVIEIDAASNNGVNEIRELRENVQYPPVSCKYKVYIIDEVHMLTGAAFNALLKTLEEPPKHAIFILATTEVHKIPATILSRCMRFDFRLISTERIAKLIAKIYDEQGKKYDNEAVFAIAKAGEGSIRDALSLADIALSYGEDKLTYDDVMDILGSSNFELINEFVMNMISGKSGEVLQTIDKLACSGKSMGVLIKDVTSTVRDLLVIKTCENSNAILALPTAKFDVMNKIASNTNEERLLRIMEIFSTAENELKYSNHPRTIFETAAVKCCRPETDYDLESLLARIKTLEDKLKNGEFAQVVVAPKVEEAKVETPKAKPVVESKKSLSDFTAADLKGLLLSNLRRLNREMLWNILQAVSIEIKGNILSIVAKNSADFEIIDKVTSKQTIKEALSELIDFEIKVDLAESEKVLEKIDQDTEKLKKIFGDDIVIIK